MSTVLLLTDAWQPTVLRIVPFSSNNARVDERHMTVKGPNASRGFPVLAVTRQQKSGSAASGSRSGGKSSSSIRSIVRTESDAYSVASNTSTHTTNHVKLPDTQHSASKQKRFAKKRVPEMHSEMKEAIRFSVQDINDQVSSSSSLTSQDDNSTESKERHSRVDNTRTRFPKPSLSSTSDARAFYTPVNGIRRSVPLTPGELELQRIRENYYVDQVQRRKKYKLNVNQLPRSTTPINDHDPDKLNMKQVIAFLQTKTVKENSRSFANDRKSENGAKNEQYSRRHSQSLSVTSQTPTIKFSRESIQSVSRSNSEVKTMDSSKHENTRQIPGCMSVMSSKSSPNFPSTSKSPVKANKAPSIHSTRSYRDNGSDKSKAVKEFKLYRFLAIAPDGQCQGFASTVTNAVPTLEKSIVTEELRNNESSRSLYTNRSKDREAGATRVLHRHAINRTVNTPPRVEFKENTTEVNTKTIRLPLMGEIQCDSPYEGSDSESMKSVAIISSKKQSSGKKAVNASQKKGVYVTCNERMDSSCTHNSLEELNKPVGTDFMELTPRSDVRIHKNPYFPKVNMMAPKQIHINVPNESKKTYSQEIVRLTLRQDKHATRVTSYMSDMEALSARQSEDNCAESGMTSTCITPRSNGDITDRQTNSSLSQTSFNRYIVNRQ